MPMPSGSSPSTDRIRALLGGRPERQQTSFLRVQGTPIHYTDGTSSPAPASETGPQQEVPDMGQYVQAPMSEPPLQMPEQPQELNKTYRVPASMMPSQSPQEIAFWKAAKGF